MTQTVTKLILTILILILIFAGGQQVYLSPLAAMAIAIVIGLAALGAMALVLSRWAMPVAALPGLVILAAMAVSAWFNADIWPVTVWRLILGAGAVAMVILVQWVDDFILLEAVSISAVIWMLVYGLSILFGFEWDNANIMAFWPVLFILAGLVHRSEFPSTGHFWAYLAINGYYLLRLDSRGAVLGLAVAVMVLYAPKINRPVMITVLNLSALSIVLFFLGPLTACRRFHYWQQAWQVFSEYLVGVGPGGLWARHLITEPGGGFQVHAHNILITWVAETGLIGILGAAIASILCVHIGVARWKWATLAGLLAWSMVDQPLWWPGPLLMTALLLGEKKE